MHRIITTEGLVLAKHPAGESNTLALILTRELGLLRASARSARKEASKLRYGIESLTEARFSLVRGRFEWKLTGVEQISHYSSTRYRARLGKVARLLLRLIHGEEPMPELFDTVRGGFGAMVRAEEDAAEAVECVLVLRILSRLGYLPQTPALAPFLELEHSGGWVFPDIERAKPLLIRTINESLSVTGL